MASVDESTGIGFSINHTLRDDELRVILAMLESEEDKNVFGLVCKRWLHLQSSEKRKLCARAGIYMLRKMAARFPYLLELDLSQSLSRSFYPGVTDGDLSVIAHGFRGLRVLNLQHCKGITDEGLSAIGYALPLLQSLDVSFCRKLTDKGLSAIAEGCHDLRSVHLSGCKSVSDETLQSFSTNCANLEDLSLQSCINITDNGLTGLAHGCRRIKALNVSKCRNIGDHGIFSVSQASSSYLTTLNFSDCFLVGDESVLSLARFCQNLETLVAGACQRITDESVMSLAVACSHGLKELRLCSCLNITDASVNCILGRCRKLEVLDIRCCEEVTDGAFRDMGDRPDLNVLKVCGCLKVTVGGIGLVLGSCKALRHLDVSLCPNVTRSGCEEAGLQFRESCQVVFEKTDMLFLM